jgi:hypothetical protein
VSNSACGFGAARFASAIAWHESDDSYYYFSFISTWAILEFTCGFLILCVPATAKILSEVRMTRWIASLQYWANTTAERLRPSRWRSQGSGWASTTSVSNHQYQDSGDPPLIPIRPRRLGSAGKLRHRDGVEFPHVDVKLVRIPMADFESCTFAHEATATSPH